MSTSKLIACMVAAMFMVFASTVQAQGYPPAENDGWYTSSDVPVSAPKPACGKMPKGGDYTPKFKMRNGVFVECAWSYVGPKKGYWAGVQECALAQDYNACLAYGPGYAGYSGNYNQGGGYQRPSSPFRTFSVPSTRYYCSGRAGDRRCDDMPAR